MIEKQSSVSQRIIGLDLLRALAVVCVLASHSATFFQLKSTFISQLLDFCGFIGVELFIVLSGFLIGDILFAKFFKNEFTFNFLKSFFLKRFLRILPLYYFVIFLLVLNYKFLGIITPPVTKYLLFFQNFYHPISTFFPETWSIPIKEWGYFFVIFLLFLLAIIKKNKPKHVLLVLFSITMISIIQKITMYYSFSIYDLKGWSYTIRSIVIYRLDSVMIGIFFALLFYFKKDILKEKLKFINRLAFLFFFLFIMLLYLIPFHSNPFFWVVFVLPLLSISIASLVPFFYFLKISIPLVNTVITQICKLSYSIYLIHYSFLISIYFYLFNIETATLFEKILLYVSYLIVSFIISYLLYICIEKPFLYFRKKQIT